MKAQKRIGTFCRKCGEQITGEKGIDFIEIPTKGCGETRYTCMKCANHDKSGRNGWESYGDKVNDLIGLETKSEMQIAVEWECRYKWTGIDINGYHLETREEINAYMASQYHLLPTHDTTVDCEYKESRRRSLHGYKNRIQGISETVNLSDPSCGHHINISKTSWNNNFYYRLEENSQKLFEPLANYLYDNENETKQVFGRYFKQWCEYSNDTFEHGKWLNIRNDRERNETCLEFRLAKFQDVNQFFYLMNFCKELMLKVDECITGNTLLSVEQTGAELVELFKKYVYGKALCMRTERNNSKAR